MAPAAILDIDGTLIDSNYQHTLAWFRAFRDHDITVPAWRIHRSIGKGGDRLIEDLAGADAERSRGDRIREAEQQHYGELIHEVVPFDGARALVVVLASSAQPDEADHYLDLLDIRELADAWTTAADVAQTKPEPDLVHAALERLEGQTEAVMVGDSTWDCIAAARAGVPTVGVLSGGFAESELRDAGATVVFESVAELGERIADTPLAG
jgi:phosphoglycolate phosphatase-like HAD superfamily hydrolase